MSMIAIRFKCCSSLLMYPIMQAMQPWRGLLARYPGNSNKEHVFAKGSCLACREGHRDRAGSWQACGRPVRYNCQGR